MNLTSERLIRDGLILGRCLMVMSPTSVDALLASKEATNRHLATHALTPEGYWFRIQTENSVGYIHASPEGGQYYRDLPAGIELRSVLPITINASDRPALGLLDEYLNLLEGLKSGISVKIVGETDSIVFVNNPGDGAQLEELAKTLMQTRRACDKSYNQQITASLLTRVRSDLFTAIGSRPSSSALVNNVARIGQEVRVLRDKYAADAQLASWFMVYEDLCRSLEKYLLDHEKDPKLLAANLVRFIAFGCGGESNPDVLTPALAEKMAHEGFHEIVEQQAEIYLKRGEAGIQQALNRQMVNDYSADLYAAGLDLFAARRLYDALKVRPREGVPARTLKLYGTSANVAEEQLVLVSIALFINLENRTGVEFEEHRLRVQNARDKGGEAAAKTVVRDLIERFYFYPRCFASKLIGDS